VLGLGVESVIVFVLVLVCALVFGFVARGALEAG